MDRIEDTSALEGYLKTLDIEIDKTYAELESMVGKKTTLDDDEKIVIRLSTTVAMLSIVLYKIEIACTEQSNLWGWKAKINSLTELVSSLKATVYARTSQLKARSFAEARSAGVEV